MWLHLILRVIFFLKQEEKKLNLIKRIINRITDTETSSCKRKWLVVKRMSAGV